MAAAMRTPLGPVTAEHPPEDAGILVDELMELVNESVDEQDLMEGLVDTFSLGELEQLAEEMAAVHAAPPRTVVVTKRSRPRRSVATTHAEAFRRVRVMR